MGSRKSNDRSTPYSRFVTAACVRQASPTGSHRDRAAGRVLQDGFRLVVDAIPWLHQGPLFEQFGHTEPEANRRRLLPADALG